MKQLAVAWTNCHAARRAQPFKAVQTTIAATTSSFSSTRISIKSCVGKNASYKYNQQDISGLLKFEKSRGVFRSFVLVRQQRRRRKLHLTKQEVTSSRYSKAHLSNFCCS